LLEDPVGNHIQAERQQYHQRERDQGKQSGPLQLGLLGVIFGLGRRLGLALYQLRGKGAQHGQAAGHESHQTG